MHYAWLFVVHQFEIVGLYGAMNDGTVYESIQGAKSRSKVEPPIYTARS
jgi:hypothetical protein